jgi:hypothetical protein
MPALNTLQNPLGATQYVAIAIENTIIHTHMDD